MPIVHIDLLEGRTSQEINSISDSIHEAMVEFLNVPVRDRFQIITEHAPGTLRFDRKYLDIDRDDEFLLVRITLAVGRTTEAKSAFYSRLCALLSTRVELPRVISPW